MSSDDSESETEEEYEDDIKKLTVSDIFAMTAPFPSSQFLWFSKWSWGSSAQCIWMW